MSAQVIAVMIARDASLTIRYAISSVQWCDGIFLLADHCKDATEAQAKSFSTKRLVIERSPFAKPAFEQGEILVRNYAIEQALSHFPASAIVLIDSDEIFTSSLLPYAKQVAKGDFSSVSLSTFHLYDSGRVIRYRETTKNGIYQIDPHVRVISSALRYVPLREGQTGHPRMAEGRLPLHVHGPIHFHLKYLRRLALTNSSLEHLPQDLTETVLEPFLESLTFPLPTVVKQALSELTPDTADVYPDVNARGNVPTTTHHDSGPSLPQLCLLVTWGIPRETEIIARVTTAFEASRWARRFQLVLISKDLLRGNLRTTVNAMNCFQDRTVDLLLHLSPDFELAKLANTLTVRVRRGLFAVSGSLRPANILAIAYADALTSEDFHDLPALAARASELE